MRQIAKRPNRGRKFNLRRVSVVASVAAGALAAGAVTSGALTSVGSDTYRVTSIKNTYAWSDNQAVIDDNMTFGIAHSDYTSAEIEEAVESSGAIDLGDKIQQERANRLVRLIGTISGANPVAQAGIQFNDGRPVKTKLNWDISIGKTLVLWMRNSSGVVWTTGSFLTATGEMWVTP